MRQRIDRLVPLRFRAAALMPAAILALHQLRFQLAFGGQADSRLAAEGHQYLGALAPLAAVLAAIGAGLFLAALSRAWRADAGDEGRAAVPSLPRIWLVAALSLLAIYVAQESLEGLLCSGHPEGIAGVFGEGGLWAVPLALALGLLVALCLRIADAAIGWAAGRRPRPRLAASKAPLALRPRSALLRTVAPLASAAAGRAPPALLAPIS